MYSWLLRRSNWYHYTVKFQDIHQTIYLLKKAGITTKDLRNESKTELAKLLGVDAIILNSTLMDKPMSDVAGLSIALLFGTSGATNEVNTRIGIFEGRQGELIWKYDYVATGGIGSSPHNLVDALMRKASTRFPYNKNQLPKN